MSTVTYHAAQVAAHVVGKVAYAAPMGTRILGVYIDAHHDQRVQVHLWGDVDAMSDAAGRLVAHSLGLTVTEDKAYKGQFHRERRGEVDGIPVTVLVVLDPAYMAGLGVSA